MLQRLTNNVLRSTTHRVVNPPPERRGQSRYSMPFFLHFRPDFLIETLPGDAWRAGRTSIPSRSPRTISCWSGCGRSNWLILPSELGRGTTRRWWRGLVSTPPPGFAGLHPRWGGYPASFRLSGPKPQGMSSEIRFARTSVPSPLAETTSTSRPDSWAASRIDWRQPPHDVTTAVPASAPSATWPPADRDPRDLVQPERLLGRGQRRDLAADPEPVAGILHIGADRDLAVDRFDRAADAEAAVRRIGAERGRAGALDEGVGNLGSCAATIKPLAICARACHQPRSTRFARRDENEDEVGAGALLLALAGCATTGPPRRSPPVEVKIIAFNDFHGNLEPPKQAIDAPAARRKARSGFRPAAPPGSPRRSASCGPPTPIMSSSRRAT